MNPETFKQVAFALSVGLGVIGPGVGIGLIGAAAVGAIGRNPEAENKIRASAILFIAFAEALAIFALVVGFIINFV